MPVPPADFKNSEKRKRRMVLIKKIIGFKLTRLYKN
jgi:hypothetical protein